MHFSSVALGVLVTALTAYEVLSHVFTWLRFDAPAFQRTRWGFGLMLILDMLAYAAVLGFGIATLGFEGLPIYWPVAVVGFVMHAGYSVPFFLAHSVYRRIHKYEHKQIFSDGQFYVGKVVALAIDVVFHAASIGILVLALPEEALAIGLMLGAAVFCALWLPRTAEELVISDLQPKAKP